MNLDKLDLAFRSKTEVEVVRLLTCNFDVGAFSLVEGTMSNALATILHSAIKFRTHLSMEPTTLDEFMLKIKNLTESSQAAYTGAASKLCGYAGKLLTETKTLLGTAQELVSFNEYSYVLKMYPWWIRPINKVFTPYVDQYADKQAFFCLPSFDLASLAKKEEVAQVTDTHIILKNKVKIPVVRVD